MAKQPIWESVTALPVILTVLSKVRSSRLLDKTHKNYSIQAVENALTVLEAFGEIDGDVGITRLSESVGMNKSYVFRLLATFEKRGYIQKGDRRGKYRLGLTAYELGQKFLSRMGILRKARRAMEHLARKCDEAVYLAVYRDREVLMLDKVDTTQMVGTVSLVGNLYPLTQTTAGKVILAFHSNLGGKVTEELSPSLVEELESIRKNGFARDSGDVGVGAASLAVPLFNFRGQVCGSLCMVGPDFRFAEDRIRNEFLPALKEAGQSVSANLGFQKYPGI